MEKSIAPKKVLGDDIVEQALLQPTDLERQRQERLAELRGLRIMTGTEVAPAQYALSVDGTGILALSDIHGLKGKQKSGKSAVLKVLTAALLSGETFRVKSELEAPVVLFIDTEQQAADVKLIIDEVRQMTGLSADDIDRRLWLFTARRLSYDTLIGDTRLLVEAVRPHVVFIDGVVDYVSSFNDEVMSRQLIHDLLLIAEEHRCAIVNVLHENKALDDLNMRGHLGTVLAQKAGNVLQCRKQGDIISVSCPDARHGTMPQWSIAFDADGHLQTADEQLALRQQQLQTTARERQREAFVRRTQEREVAVLTIVRDYGGRISRKELTEELMKRAAIGHSTASGVIKSLCGKKLNEVNGLIQAVPGEEMAF